MKMTRIEAGHYTAQIPVQGMTMKVEVMKFDGLWNAELICPNHCSESCSFFTKAEAAEWAQDMAEEVFTEMMDV